jgi:hypothetical protein
MIGEMRAFVFALGSLAIACGGGDKKPVKPKPVKPKPVAPKEETEADREAKRLAAAHAIVPDGSDCIPAAIAAADASRTLELGALDGKPFLCAIDRDDETLLGPVGCWSIDTSKGALTYHAPTPLPGRSFQVKLDGKCARGYCLPDSAALPPDGIVHIAWSAGGDKVAVMTATEGSPGEVHVFGAADKAHQSKIDLADEAHGDKKIANAPIGMVAIGDTVWVIGADAGPFAGVWGYKADGSAMGPVERLGAKVKGPVSIHAGSVSVFGDGTIALNENGMMTVTTVDVATGKRGKLVRKLPKSVCKPKELDAYFVDQNAKLSAKCKKEIDQVYAPFVKASLVPGKKNHLVLLRGARNGELAVVDAKTLEENRHFVAKWCEK